MNSSECFRVNNPNVIHEIIDGEAVIVNLNNGNYYSTDSVGADVWHLIENGATVGQIVDTIAAHYNGDRAEVEDGVYGLMTRLRQEGLIVADNAPGPNANPGPDLAGSARADRPAFEKPVLHRYADMEDLLLLDPIHDVDETGWPNVNPDNA